MTKGSMMHVGYKAQKVFDKLREEGFGGCSVLTCEEEGIWHEQYAIFVMQFDFPEPSDNKYITFDYYSWEQDLYEYLDNEFHGCTIKHYKGCNEFEIIGPRLEEFYAKYGDDLEQVAEIVEGWTIFTKTLD